MDCCNYGEFRQAHGQYAGAGWDGYGYALPYAPYAHSYYAPHAHDPYARYYRYDYPAMHTPHTEHAMPMDYGGYASKESRVRRTLSRREQRSHFPVHHPPHLQTPSSECGINGRSASYCEPHMWPHYQMGVFSGNGWSANNALNGTWTSRGMCSREQMRYMSSDCRMIKGSHLSHSNPMCPPDGRPMTYPVYEDPFYVGDNAKHSNTVEFPVRTMSQPEPAPPTCERIFTDPLSTPPEEKRPPIVPLPAFQQAFGSTEIGKFAEAFSRAEVGHEIEDVSNDNFVYDTFQDWDGSPDGQWPSPSTAREIKCEENY